MKTLTRSAEAWRAMVADDRANRREAMIAVRIPATLRAFLDERSRGTETALSELVRVALLDWAMAVTTPDRRAYHAHLSALWAIHCTDQVEPYAGAWSDPHPNETEQLQNLVRLTPAKWAARHTAEARAEVAQLQAEMRLAEARELTPELRETFKAMIREVIHEIEAGDEH